VSASVTAATTHLVCSASEFRRRTNKVLLAGAKGLPIVTESWLDACETVGAGQVDPIPHLLGGGGGAQPQQPPVTAAPSLPATAAAAAPAATAGSHRAPVAPVAPAAVARWSWAGDSPGNPGAQDKWVPYDDAMNRKLEAAHAAGQARPSNLVSVYDPS
jgi:hypothetical protein